MTTDHAIHSELEIASELMEGERETRKTLEVRKFKIIFLPFLTQHEA
jgi:hypothetical protein